MSAISLNDFQVAQLLSPKFSAVSGSAVTVAAPASGALPTVPDQQYTFSIDASANLVLQGQSSSPSPAVQALAIAPTGDLSVQSLYIAGVKVNPDGTSGVQSVAGLQGAIELQGAGGIKVDAKGDTITITGPAGAPLTGQGVVGPGGAPSAVLLDFSAQTPGAFIVQHTTNVGVDPAPLFQISYTLTWDGTTLYASSMDGNVVVYNQGSVSGYAAGVNPLAKSQLVAVQDAAGGAGFATTTSVVAYRIAAAPV